MKINTLAAACCLACLFSGTAYAVDYRVQTTESRSISQSELSRISNTYQNFKAGSSVNAFVTISDFNSSTAPKTLQANWYHCGQLIYQQSKPLDTINSHFKRGLHHAWFWINSTEQIAGSGRVDIFADNQPVGSTNYQVNDKNGRTVSCQGQTSPAAITVPAAFVLSGDALFHFNGSGRHEMYDDGAQQIRAITRQIATQYPGNHLRRITVTGYTDYLGNDSYNQALSERRAETVKQIMAENGIPAYLINTAGGGESKPVKQCSAALPRPELKECLAPNRRVEITAETE
ncbi:OmpA family protein [Stenoxybacter acetivorans]|uniref:OmpA family protein n=1 Tax=Stenoxybacter acetivorans TaxID=422441 RepID=UPI00068B8C20|nr:OmpA family protein [Stenoxybacter acetivorans]